MHLRNAGVADTDVLSAIERVPRENFIPPTFADRAYEDQALPIGRGQTISQPLVVALMTQALKLNDRDKVLEIGTGSGYQAAILAQMCRRLYTIERHRPLFLEAQAQLEALKLRNVTAICGDGMKGWPGQAPFDKIMITAAAREKPPAALLDQLKIGGILVCPVGTIDSGQMMRRYTKESEDTWAVKELFPVRFVPLLPDIAREDEQREVAI